MITLGRGEPPVKIGTSSRVVRRDCKEISASSVSALGNWKMHEEYRDAKVKELRDQLVRFASDLEFPELLAGRLPPGFENLKRTNPGLASTLQRLTSPRDPIDPYFF